MTATAAQTPRAHAARQGRILVVDDEINARTALAELLQGEGYEVDTAADALEALAKLDTFEPHLVLTDLKMPGMDGIELLKRLAAEERELAVVVMTAYGTVDTAVQAMRGGAIDYLTKPLHFDELLVVVERALERQNLRAETRMLKARLAERHRSGNIIGDSPQMQRLFKVIDQVAPSRATVLITGESGTGKELVAEAIHQLSPRAQGPFIKLHCAALAETLLESELFGHERGAFTGAAARRDGRFQLAHGGTLFLDEIGEISPAVQIKLLRFLQEREFERVGGSETIEVDVRVIVATNRNLADHVARGLFREDLYYRLNVVSIDMPPLRDRRSDIPLLAEFFLRRYAKQNGKQIRGFTEGALQMLMAYPWPGNVRELENAVERAVVMSTGPLTDCDALPAQIAPRAGQEQSVPRVPGSTLEELERHAILKTLEAAGGSTSRASEILGISVRKIQYKLHAYKEAPKSHVEAVRSPNGRTPRDSREE